MPAYTYTGDDSRYYPTLGLEAEPGASADFTDPPEDGRWQIGSAPSVTAPAPASAPVVEPLP